MPGAGAGGAAAADGEAPPLPLPVATITSCVISRRRGGSFPSHDGEAIPVAAAAAAVVPAVVGSVERDGEESELTIPPCAALLLPLTSGAAEAGRVMPAPIPLLLLLALSASTPAGSREELHPPLTTSVWLCDRWMRPGGGGGGGGMGMAIIWLCARPPGGVPGPGETTALATPLGVLLALLLVAALPIAGGYAGCGAGAWMKSGRRIGTATGGGGGGIV